jgi:hypothetical protein
MYTGLMTIQVDFVLDTDAFIPVIPVFSDDPRVLLFSDEGPRYVPAP